MVKVLQTAWAYVAYQKPNEVAKMNKTPVKRLKFIEYEVEDRFYLRHMPDSQYQHYSDPKRTKMKISPKLQRRYIGPYTITRKFSPVLYQANINGEIRTVHAIQMQPDRISRYYTMHRTDTPIEQLKKPGSFKAKLLPSGRPEIPHRIHKRLRSYNSPLINTLEDEHKDIEEDDNQSSEEDDDEDIFQEDDDDDDD